VILANLIVSSSDRLTPTERRIAEAVTEDPTLLAFGTVSGLAEHVGTSRPSIVRFANKLGYSGYSELQEEVRAGLAQQLTRPSQRIRRQDEPLALGRTGLEAALASTFAALGGGKLAELARPIATARQLWVVSGETSQAGAHAFHSGIKMIRSNVHWVEEHSAARDLTSAKKGDVVVAFDFARYRRHATLVTRSLADAGVQVVAVTDGPLSPLAALTDTWCGIQVPAVGPFDSSVPAVIVAELLVAQVASELRDAARDKIDRTEALWEATGTFL